jgi:predicted alpha/beta hydrolase
MSRNIELRAIRGKTMPDQRPVDAVQQGTPVELTAPDGFVLGATLFGAAPDAQIRRAAVLCPGGGVPSRVYRRFAAWLAAGGMPVLTFDYRGIGRSRPANSRGCDASFEDWSDQDCAAAIAWLRKSYPQAELAGLAHSIGGLILAGAPGAAQIERFLLIGAHTAYHRDYHARWRLPMTVMWHGVMPALCGIFGYFPGAALRIGEDLPATFAMQWARRRTPDFAAGNPRLAACIARGGELRGRALALTFTDDGFATAHGTRRVLQHLKGISAEHRVIAPRDAGMKKIGHFGFFRPSAEQALWKPAGDWLA